MMMIDDDDDWQANTYVTPRNNWINNAVIFQNVRSLRRNYDKLKNTLVEINNNPLAIFVSEIWAPHPLNEILPGFHPLIKKERKSDSSNKGGGVGFFIRSDVQYQAITMNSIERTCELIGVTIPKHKLAIIGGYRSPSTDPLEFTDYLVDGIRTVKTRYPRYKILVGGDFNINIAETTSSATENLTIKLQNLGFACMINQPTRVTDSTATIIDLIFSNDPSLPTSIGLTDISDHMTTICFPKIKVKLKSEPQWRRCFNETNITKLKNNLRSQSWSRVYKSKSPCRVFHSILAEQIDKTCPKKKYQTDNRTPIRPWMKQELLKERDEKALLHKKALLTRTKADWQEYKLQKQKYNNLIRKHKRDYIIKRISENFGNSKKIWETVNSFLNRTREKEEGIPCLKVNGGKTTDAKEIVELLNTFYTSIGPNLASKFNTTETEMIPPNKTTKLSFRTVREKEVEEVIKSMKPKKSSGHDELSNDLIKQLSGVLITPLTYIINEAITHGTFPKEWKKAKIVPLYKKKGDPEDCTNYRPISLLPTLSKVIEKIIEKQIRTYMDTNNYWSKTQFGFRAGHETGHAVTRAIHEILDAKSQNLASIAIFLDLKKAFDTVDHCRLIRKMSTYGIDTKLIESYLTNRNQYTEIKEVKSKPSIIECGVPQGSILGPLFFLIYINDLDTFAPIKNLLFADDTTIIVSSPDQESLIAKTNETIIMVEEWFKANKLTVHPGKTNYMVFNTKNRENFNGKIRWGDVKLDRVGKGEKEETVKYVGIHIDEDLNFKRQGEHAANKIKTNSFLLSCNKNILPFSIRKMIYNALIRPFLDYGADIWGPANVSLISKIQKACVRHVMRTKNFIEHTTKHFLALKTPRFEDLITYHQLRLCQKIIHTKTPPGLIEVFPTPLPRHANEDEERRLNNLQIRKHDYANKHEVKLPPIQAPKTWNDLDTQQKKIEDITQFKKAFFNKLYTKYAEEPPCNKKHCPSCLTSRPF